LTGLYLIVGFFALVFIGVPIGASIGLVSVGYLLQAMGIDGITIFASRLFTGSNSYELMAIPLFVLAGDLLYEGKISKTLVNLANSLVGSVTGGMAMVTTLACQFFGAVSGSGPATTAAVGAVVAKDMEEDGYPRDFTAATIAASGPLGVLIPPSILAVVYGCTTGVSIGKLLVAGIGPGIAYGTVMFVYEYYTSKKNGYGTKKQFSLTAVFKALKESMLALMIPVIILGGIYSGLFTPTEAACVSVVYAFIIGMFIYKSISWRTLPRIFKGSAVTAATIMFITGNIALLSWVLTRERIPETLASMALSYVGTPIMYILVSNVILLFAGMVESGSSTIILLAPLMHPIAVAFGIDPVFYGAMTVANLAIGMITPPVAATLYVAQRVCDVSITDLIRRIWPYFFVQLIALLICILVPNIFMFLPSLLG
jgi:C4-dicarboxylate transporter DctM subunit